MTKRLGSYTAAALISITAAWGNTILGPTSSLFVTDGYFIYDIKGDVAGPNVSQWATNYSFDETPIAVDTSIRTGGGNPGTIGGLYTLGGIAMEIAYSNPSSVSRQFTIYDGTSDAAHNYFVAGECTGCTAGGVYQTNPDWSDPGYLFTAGTGNLSPDSLLSISYDAYMNSLWVADFAHIPNQEGTGTMIWNYSLSGTLLDSFSLGPDHYNNTALAFDPADRTIWLGRYQSQVLEQWSTTPGNHVLLQTIFVPQLSTINSIFGGEFAEFGAVDTPEPRSVGLVAMGLLLAAACRRYAKARL
jgi:hypothetical protein